jgi:6-phosphogluconolactonase (cycloisomerase 2 family)
MPAMGLARLQRWCLFLLGAGVATLACSSDDDDAGQAVVDGGATAGSGAGGKAAAGASAGKANGGMAAVVAGSGSLSAAGSASAGGVAEGGAAGAPGSGIAGENAAQGGSGGASGSGGDGPTPPQAFAYVSALFTGLSTLKVDGETGDLSTLTGSPVNQGAHLYNVAVDHAGHFAYTLDVDSGVIAVFPIALDGTLPEEPSSSLTLDFDPTTLAIDPADHFLYVAATQAHSLSIFSIDADDGALTAATSPLDLETPPASVAIAPNGQFLYVSQEVAGGIRAFSIDPDDGSLDELSDSPYAVDRVRAGALVFRPDGAFLYSTGFALNGFAVADDGGLAVLTDEPFSLDIGSDYYATNLAVDPRGQYLYATEFLLTRHVSGYAIDAESGMLTAAGAPVTARSPYSVAVDPSGRFIYASNDDDTISGYRLKRSDGTLKELAGSPFPFGGLQPEMAFATAR